MGSRGIYHDGWFASAFGPRIPWAAGLSASIASWTPDDDTWELYNIDNDWSQANDLAAEMPEKLAQMKETFAIEFARNNGYPVGGGLWILLHPEFRVASPYTEWTFPGRITRMPEFTAPRLGSIPNLVTDGRRRAGRRKRSALLARSVLRRPDVLRARRRSLLRVQLFEIARTQIKATEKMPEGKVKIEVQTTYVGTPRPAGPLSVTLKVNGVTSWRRGRCRYLRRLRLRLTDVSTSGRVSARPSRSIITTGLRSRSTVPSIKCTSSIFLKFIKLRSRPYLRQERPREEAGEGMGARFKGDRIARVSHPHQADHRNRRYGRVPHISR